MNTISSISELLSLSGSQFRVYDMGRRIEKISKDTFNKIELNQLPYPFPIQAHACFAIVFWQKKSSQPFLWFIKLPLDERGLINQGARNHFIAIIVEALGKNITEAPSEKQEELLKNNPYHHTPAQYKLAALNSIIHNELKQEMSAHHAVFLHYLTHAEDWDNWQKIGVQGINDFAALINKNNNANILAQSIAFLPKQVCNPLCIALENQTLPNILIKAILDKIKRTDLDDETKNNLLRSLSSSTQNPIVTEYINALLEHPSALNSNTIILFSGRLWNVFEDTSKLLCFFEIIAKQEDVALFNEIFRDLVAIPLLRQKVFEVMRAPERSEALSCALGHIFQTTGKR